jgi:Ca2+-binding EF-hand superfamily protein
VLPLQVNHVDEWLSCLRSTFEAMDADKDGRLKPNEILEALKAKLPEAEVSDFMRC